MTESAAETETKNDGWEWMIVEIMGHRKHAGRVREEERFGAKMLRIDVPLKGDPAAHGWETHYYASASIFSFTLTDEATALHANLPWDAPARYRRLPAPEPQDDDDAVAQVEFSEGSEGGYEDEPDSNPMTRG